MGDDGGLADGVEGRFAVVYKRSAFVCCSDCAGLARQACDFLVSVANLQESHQRSRPGSDTYFADTRFLVPLWLASATYMFAALIAAVCCGLQALRIRLLFRLRWFAVASVVYKRNVFVCCFDCAGPARRNRGNKRTRYACKPQ